MTETTNPDSAVSRLGLVDPVKQIEEALNWSTPEAFNKSIIALAQLTMIVERLGRAEL